MQTCLVVLPNALEHENDRPLFPKNSRAITELTVRGHVLLVSSQDVVMPEKEWVGLPLDVPSPSAGVLAVAAFGADPPEHSSHFCLNLLTTASGSVVLPNFDASESEFDTLWQACRRLETTRLKLVRGQGLEHGLVWERGSVDLMCQEPQKAIDSGLNDSLPAGEGEEMLRRFIDDSVNLLSDLEVNRIRQEEGLEPLNLLWPWGPGFRPTMPNLPTERGTGVFVESSSVRFKGLCRLVGYRHGDPWKLGSGTNLKLEIAARTLQNAPMGLAVLPTIGKFRERGNHEEAAWLGNEILSRLVEPLIPRDDEEPRRILLVATRADCSGLALDYRSNTQRHERHIPFSAEALEERSLPTRELHKVIEEALTIS